MWQKIKDAFKTHGTLIAGGVVGVLVAAYLVLRSQASQSPQSAQITFPPSGGGGSAGGTDSGNSTSTQVNPIALTLSQLQGAWHLIGVQTGAPWNYTQWASGITSSLPTGTSIPNLSNVLTYVWNTINSPGFTGDPVAFLNTTLNDAIANPTKYTASGTPVLPAPAPTQTPTPTPVTNPVTPAPTPISVSQTSHYLNGLVSTQWGGVANPGVVQ